MSVLDLQINVWRSYHHICPYRLSCDTECLLTGQPVYKWYRNNRIVGSGQTLNLCTVSSGDEYTCRVSGSRVSSPAVCEFGALLFFVSAVAKKNTFILVPIVMSVSTSAGLRSKRTLDQKRHILFCHWPHHITGIPVLSLWIFTHQNIIISDFSRCSKASNCVNEPLCRYSGGWQGDSDLPQWC